MLGGLYQQLQEQTGMELSPVGTETGQSTQELPCPRLVMGLTLFLSTVVLGDLSGTEPEEGGGW